LNLDIDIYEVLVLTAVLILLYIFSGILVDPLKGVLRFLAIFLVALLSLLLINLIGKHIDLFIPINPFTIVITGLLGLPGVILLVAINIII